LRIRGFRFCRLELDVDFQGWVLRDILDLAFVVQGPDLSSYSVILSLILR